MSMKKIICLAFVLILFSYYGGQMVAKHKIASQKNSNSAQQTQETSTLDDSNVDQGNTTQDSDSSDSADTITDSNNDNDFGTTEDSNSDNNSAQIESGKEITLKKDAPVCSSKKNVDLMIDYVKNKNETAIELMEQNGEAKVIPAGTKITIVDSGILVTEIEDESGDHWFAPYETFE